VVFNTGLYTDLPDNSILITANMQSETGFPSSHQLKSYIAFKSRLKLAARAARCPVSGCWPSCFNVVTIHCVSALFPRIRCIPLKIALSYRGCGLSIWFLGPTRILNPNGISIGFAGLTTVTDRQTDRPTDHATRSVKCGHIYMRNCAAA